MRGNTLLVSPKMRLHFVGESAGTPLFAAGPALVSSKLPDQDLFGFLSVGSWQGVLGLLGVVPGRCWRSPGREDFVKQHQKECLLAFCSPLKHSRAALFAGLKLGCRR